MNRMKSLKLKNKKMITIISIISVFILSAVCIFAVNSNKVTFENQNIASETISDFKEENGENSETMNNDNKEENHVSPIKDNENISVNAPVKTVGGQKNNEGSVSKIPTVVPSKSGFDFSKWNNSCDPMLVVVNKDNPLPQNYNPSVIDYNGKQINKTMKVDLDNMINDATKDGIKLYVSSGYRSVARQTTLFNNQVEKCKKQGHKASDAETMAATVVAKPGTSEHNTGLAIDFNGVRDDFYKTKEYKWLIKHASDYGFILRYDNNKKDITNVIYEPWHFRYIGKEHAKNISKSGMCLEEYIESIIKK